MINLQSKIYKLLKALELKGYIYLLNKEQIYSNKLGKILNVNKLYRLMPVQEYNKLYPNKKKDLEKYKNVKVEILSTFKKSDILLRLVEIYKEVGEMNGIQINS